jgi:hypothetical protein
MGNYEVNYIVLDSFLYIICSYIVYYKNGLEGCQAGRLGGSKSS